MVLLAKYWDLKANHSGKQSTIHLNHLGFVSDIESTLHGRKIVLLLNGGNKSTQQTDIKKAQTLWEIYKSERNDKN